MSASHLKKCQVFIGLIRYGKANHWSIEQTAQALETSEETIDYLLSGQIAEFSIDQLIGLVSQAGLEVSVSILPKAA